MVYERYASPRDLLSMYIDAGNLDELVTEILIKEHDRRKEEAEKENDRKLWEMYLHSDTTLSYNDWKNKVMENAKAKTPESGRYTLKRDEDMTDEDVDTLLKKLFPNQAKGEEAPT